MSTTKKIGTVAVAPPAAVRTWAPATLACMGVVFGDIGTSPLYTLGPPILWLVSDDSAGFNGQRITARH